MIKLPVHVIDWGPGAKLQDADYWLYPGVLPRDEADQIAQALNDGERYKKALNEILQIPSVIGCQPYLTMRKIAADALREGAGES